MRKLFSLLSILTITACTAADDGSSESMDMPDEAVIMAAQEEQVEAEVPEYFLLRPEVERAYGYSHAVKIGDDIKISGAVSMDDAGTPTAVGDLEQQMKNAYSDLDKVLQHYGYTFDDVVVENVYTTDMARFLEVSTYRNSIYTKQFPTGTWLEVKGLALPELMIEIELEAHRSR